MIPVEEIQALGVVPREALRLWEARFGDEGVGEGDHAVVDADFGPKLTDLGEVVGAVGCAALDWDRDVAG